MNSQYRVVTEYDFGGEEGPVLVTGYWGGDFDIATRRVGEMVLSQGARKVLVYCDGLLQHSVLVQHATDLDQPAKKSEVE